MALLCRVLQIARAGYDAWARRGVAARARADVALTGPIARIQEESRGTDGAPRVHAALRARGGHCGARRVAWLLRAAGLVGCHRRRRARTTVADPAGPPAATLIARDFSAPAPNRWWIGDITSVSTWAGWLSLAVLLDVHARRVVGWARADHRRAALALEALALALADRRPAAGLVQHPDRGCQDTAGVYQEALAARGIAVSMPRAGEGDDNALAERCFATLKGELVDTRPWPTRRAARQAIFAWIAVFYHRRRVHSALGDQRPVAFARARAAAAPAA
ncbi:MAG TPA: IS3 family transposase [Nitrolancea sp.]|nr:IS3 family transposase [Nitrolancea sp.]